MKASLPEEVNRTMDAEREETRCIACSEPDPPGEHTETKEAGSRNGPSRTECPPHTETYTVAPSENFFDIANKFNIQLDELLQANPSVDPDRLRAHQELCIPDGKQAAGGDHDCPRGTKPYTLKRGDNFFNLARQFNTTIDAILGANPDVDPDRLEIGEVVCIPVDTDHQHVSCPEGTLEYGVGECQTLFRIANRFRLTVREMLQINPHLVDPDDLQVGQVICVPTYKK